MGHVVLTSALAFQRTEPDNPMVPVGPEQIVRRGGRVPDYVRDFHISALSNAGVIGPAPDDAPPVFEPAPEPAVPNPEVPPPPGTFNPVPENPAQIVDDPDTDTEPVTRPTERDSKAKWEAYAVQVGIPQGDAESMNKATLISEVERIEAAQASGQDPFVPQQ